MSQDPISIITEFTKLEHRGVATEESAQARDLLKKYLQDENGGMPNIHRPEDTMSNVESELVRQTVDFVKATVGELVS